MVVIGLDFGNQRAVVAIKTKWGIDLVFDDISNVFDIPSVVFFHDKRRYFGTQAFSHSLIEPSFAVFAIKRLIGVLFSESREDIERLPFVVKEGPDGFPLIHINYKGGDRTFTPTQVLAMMFTYLKGIAQGKAELASLSLKHIREEFLARKYQKMDVLPLKMSAEYYVPPKIPRKDPVEYCCIGIPAYFTDLQRRAILDAAKIAGLNQVRLIHELTATALAFGVYKVNLSENKHANVVFVDTGDASMQVAVARYEKGSLKILAHSFDRSLGGRDFHEVLFEFFATMIKKNFDKDISQNARASYLLRAAFEEVKKGLCENPEDKFDLTYGMESDVYCQAMKPIFVALSLLGLSSNDFEFVIDMEKFQQLCGSILKRVKRPLQCALAEAGLSVENIHAVYVDGNGSRVPAIIKILTDFFGKKPERTMDGRGCVRGCALQSEILSRMPNDKEFLVHERFPFEVRVSWRMPLPGTQVDESNDGQWIVLFPKGSPMPSVRALKFNESSTLVLDVWYSEGHPLSKISSYTIGPPENFKGEHVKMEVKLCLNLDGIVSVESATVEVPETTSENTTVPVKEFVIGALSSSDLQAAMKQEEKMHNENLKIVEEEEEIYAMQSYLYVMGLMINGPLSRFVDANGSRELFEEFNELESELENCDTATADLVSRFGKLKTRFGLIEKQYEEFVERRLLDYKLECLLIRFREAASSATFDHIELSEKELVVRKCHEVEAWLNEGRKEGQENGSIVIPNIELRGTAKELERFCVGILSKPRPVLHPQPNLDSKAAADLDLTNKEPRSTITHVPVQEKEIQCLVDDLQSR